MGYSPEGCTVLNMTEATAHAFMHSHVSLMTHFQSATAQVCVMLELLEISPFFFHQCTVLEMM